jgi:2-isopropylmalate synthase
LDQICIFDTTLRDGEQTPGVNFNVQEKLEIAMQLERLQVDVIEAGFPVASPGDFAAVQAVAAEVRGPVIAALARATDKDIARAWEAVRGAAKPRIHTFIATSPVHMQFKLRRKPEEVLRAAWEATVYAKSLTPDVEFSAEDATRSDPGFLVEVFAAVIEAGATVINIPDTVGYAIPDEFARLIAYIRSHTPGIDRVVISVHCHNDLGLAVANTLAAMGNGATQAEVTMNGLGERAGNAALEELVMAVRTRRDHLGVETGIRTEHIYRTSRLVSTLAGVPVQANKAVVGDNAFAHESGIHQDGFLKERTTYEIMTPESVGLTQSKLVLGKHSGRHAFRERLRELGYTLSDEEMQKAFERFIELADRKKHVSDRDIEAIVSDEIVAVPAAFTLDYLCVTSGNATVPTATVRITTDDGSVQQAACGDGPVDAVYRAIDAATGIPVHLVSYSIQGVTGGRDALGEVTVRIQDNGNTASGRGTSTDIIEASARAYLQAINRLVHEIREKKAKGAHDRGYDDHREDPGRAC